MCMVRTRFEVAERVHESRIEQLCEAFSLLVAEAGGAPILIRPRDVDLLVRHIEIATGEYRFRFLEILQ